jgi:hypothetical protein
MAAMDTYELKALLAAEKADALGLNTSQLASERARALDYYYGNMSGDMPTFDGRSSAVSSDVADVVEGLMPGLMDVFASTDEPVKFNPVGPEDEDAAEQETDYVNHVFMQKNPGFLVLYSFIKDALLSKVGIVKVAWETYEREETETYHNLGDDEFSVMAADPDLEVTAHTEFKDGLTGQTLHDVTLSKRKEQGFAKCMPVPPEEFGISKRTRTLKDAAYCYHEPAGMTQSDLIGQGYDAAQVEALPSASGAAREETISRDTVEVGSRAQTSADEMNKAMRPILVTEHYIRMDYDGKGKPKLYRVTTGGTEYEVLKRKGEPDVVEVDTMPFACMTPVIVTHRFFGRSIADLVIDIQKIKTALLRALLDNMYLANNQRLEVGQDGVHERTMDDLLVNRPGGIVRTKRVGSIMPIPNQPIGPFAFPLMEYIDSIREHRTGLSLQSQGLDANALSNQSATAVNVAFTATQAKMKLIARIFAETGIRDLFQLLHGVIRKNDTEANTVRLRNKWVTVDPRNWQTREDMTVTVGLGTGSKEAQVAQIMSLMNVQKEHMMGGLPTVSPDNIYNSAAELTKLVGQKNPELFFTDPKSPQGQQIAQAHAQKPDPRMAETQANIQIGQAKAQADLQLQQAKIGAQTQADQAKMQSDAAMAQQQMQAEFVLKREQMNAELQLKREQMLMEMALKKEQMQAEVSLKSRIAGAGDNPVPVGNAISGVHMGGQPG